MGWVWEEGCEGHVTASESAEERTTLAGGSCQFYDQRSLQYQHCGLAGMRQERPNPLVSPDHPAASTAVHPDTTIVLDINRPPSSKA